MQLKYYSLIVCLIFLSSCDRKPVSQIDTIDSLVEVCHNLRDADPKTLIVLDVDETLITPCDALWQQGRIWELDYAKQLPIAQENKCTNKHDQERGTLPALSRRLLFCNYQLVEEITAKSIEEMQAKNVKVIALTNMGPGEFGFIPSIKEWRYAQLQKVGIVLDASFADLAIIFDQLPPVQSGFPEFYRGILFAANNFKGTVLGTFLDSVDWKPTKVIFIDDKEKYIYSVQEEMAKRGIPFHGYIYNGAEKYTKPVDPAIVALQVDHLNRYDALISDDDAHKLLEIQKVGIGRVFG